jgi:hypothetical protein
MVGDVVGHGNPSALRLRPTMPGTLGDIVTDVNREFVRDVEDSAQFKIQFVHPNFVINRILESLWSYD